MGVKFSAKAWTASTMPIVDKAKNAPRSRKMPRPKTSASALTHDAGSEQARGQRPCVGVHQPNANVTAEAEEDDAAEIDVTGITQHQIEIARERDIKRVEQ